MSASHIRWLVSGVLILLPWPLLAQQQAVGALEPDEEAILEEVHVTGSRVRRSNLDAPSPVIIIDRQMLVDGGFTTLGEFSRYLPQNADNFSDSWTGNTRFTGSAGFNLRGIGLDGTLTLVNGRRIAPYGNSTDTAPFVDINAIPVAAIERVEILKDGASAIYGSEAVAGVVNIILRQEIQQASFEAGYLTNSHGDGDELDASLTGGWSNHTTRLVGTMSWFDRSIIWSRDREFSRDANFSQAGGFNGRNPMSSPPTIRILNPVSVVADPGCPGESDIASFSSEPLPNGTPRTLCRFNFAQFLSLQQPSTRWSGTGSLQHDFTNGLIFFAEAIYSQNETRSVLSPTPLANYLVLANHPQNPFGKDLRIGYRVLDAGDRGFDNMATTWRLVAGLEGQLAGWEWETGLTRSEAENDRTRFNSVLGAGIQAALLGRGGPNADQYYNPFGLNPKNPQDVLNQFLISGTGTLTASKETSADAQINGSFWELPGGPVGAAAGVQWRQIELDQSADPEELSGVILGGAGILPLIEDRTVESAFAELVLPLLPSLEAQLALRYDHYSDFGSTTNPKLGLGWRPWNELLIRATWGTSFRPPTFRELFDPPFESEGFIASDLQRCPVTGAPEDCLPLFVPAFNRGNPDLQPDEGETRLLGLAWEPARLAGLELTIELWEIEHSNRILASESVFDVLLEEIPPDLNPLVVRAPASAEDLILGIPGPIVSYYSTYINAGKVTTRGLDFSTRYLWTGGRSGDWQWQIDYTYLDEYEIGISQYGVEILQDWAGGYGETSGLPKNRGNLSLSWDLNANGATLQFRYIGSYNSPLGLIINNQDTGREFEVDAYTQLDLQYSRVFDSLRGGTLRLGCQNCLENKPPAYNHTTTAEPFHEGRGAVLYLRWMQPF